MKRSVYEAPVTYRFQIELESAFCSGSADVDNPNNTETGQIDEHKTNTDFSADFGNTDWDK